MGGHYKSVSDLFDELDREEAQLELWGRHDGVPLLMRVVHILQIKVTAEDEQKGELVLLHTWQQETNGMYRTCNRLLAKKVSTATDKSHFKKAAEEAVLAQLSYLAGVHFSMNPDRLPTKESAVKSEVKVHKIEFLEHRYDIEDSPHFKGMHTMYHIYTMEAYCEGHPRQNFTSIDFTRQKGALANGWRWVTWPQVLDCTNARSNQLERQLDVHRKSMAEQ